MDRSDPAGIELIRDIGRQCSLSMPGVTTEQELMQRSSDPLLVREFLARRQNLELVQTAASPMSGDATITLARSILAQGSLEPSSHPQVSRRYPVREPLLANSLAPSPFEPSARDREDALDLENSQRADLSLHPAAASPSTPSMALAFIAILLWLMFQFAVWT
jgi:hypothetical protein